MATDAGCADAAGAICGMEAIRRGDDGPATGRGLDEAVSDKTDPPPQRGVEW